MYTDSFNGRDAFNARVPADANEVDSEGLLRLVQGLFLSASDNAPRQVVFCGVGADNGSSSVCANAARTLAVYGSRSVCVVDGNLRSQKLSALLDIEENFTPRRGSFSASEDCIQIGDNLFFASAHLLAAEGRVLAPAERVKLVLAELRQNFDFVLIDAPGGDVSGDAAILARLSHGTLLVIDAESTRRISARKVKESFDAAGVRLVGTILRNRSFPIPKALYERL